MSATEIAGIMINVECVMLEAEHNGNSRYIPNNNYRIVLKKGKFYRVNSRLGTRKTTATEIAGTLIRTE